MKKIYTAFLYLFFGSSLFAQTSYQLGMLSVVYAASASRLIGWTSNPVN